MSRSLLIDPLAVRTCRSRRLWMRWTALGLVACGLMLGCGGKSGPQRVEVDGSILASDKLLPNGTIRFLPEPGNNSPIAMTSVTGGLYRFTEADGPYPGKYKVVVNLELESSVLSKMSSTSSDMPRMNWEVLATVPEKKNATLHFDWPKDEPASETNASAKAAP